MIAIPFRIKLSLIFLLLFPGCYKFRGHYGGMKSYEPVARKIVTDDVALPEGYKLEAVATGLTYPTGITFDEEGSLYVLESGYSYGEVWTTSRLLKVENNGTLTEIARGSKNGPWNGVDFRNGYFYIAEGGQLEGGRILKVSRDGKNITALATDLPGVGDHHTNGPVAADDGYIYFGQGTATNSAVVGEDNMKFGWLSRYPDFHDIPCKDITLTGQNFETSDFRTIEKHDKVHTGAFSPYGTPTSEGQVIKGRIPCTGAIMRVPEKGGEVELVAWGLRNPFGLAFSPGGKLFTTENSYDTRGSRPGYGTGDVLWEITPGTWYGWPDFAAGRPMTDPDFKTPHDDPRFLLKEHPQTPPKPSAVLAVHAAAGGLDFSRSENFGYTGEAFIAEFGDMAPQVGRIYGPVGFKVVRVNVNSGIVNEFAVNKGRINGPASNQEGGGLERPIAVKFDPTGSYLYIVDYGVMPVTEQGPAPKKETGVIWKVSKNVITKNVNE